MILISFDLAPVLIRGRIASENICYFQGAVQNSKRPRLKLTTRVTAALLRYCLGRESRGIMVAHSAGAPRIKLDPGLTPPDLHNGSCTP
jgi:hypothetical protein